MAARRPTVETVSCSASALPLGADGKLPTEFRIFKKGLNETSKGPFLFDEIAARSVLEQYRREGVDLIVDLEHLSLDADSPNYDPDARGHFQLAVRDGELWACNVRWTGDGQRRLSEKTQRYISPVAMRETESKRVLSIFNVGLVAQPATHGALPLVAASRRLARGKRACKALSARIPLGKSMNPELLEKILAAIEAGEDKSGILKEIVKTMGGGAGAGDLPPVDADPLATTADMPPEEEPMVDPKKEEPLSSLSKTLGFASDAVAAAEIKKLFKEVNERRAVEAKLDLEARCGLVAELVSLGVEFPATAWKKNADGSPNGKAPVDRLASEPLAELRQRVQLHKDKGGRKAHTPPVEAPSASPVAAPPQVVALAKKKGLTPEQLVEARKNAARRI